MTCLYYNQNAEMTGMKWLADDIYSINGCHDIPHNDNQHNNKNHDTQNNDSITAKVAESCNVWHH